MTRDEAVAARSEIVHYRTILEQRAETIMSEETSRLDALEMRVAHQDATIEALDAALTRQWRTIDALAREVTTLSERLADLGRRDPTAPEPPPPHY